MIQQLKHKFRRFHENPPLLNMRDRYAGLARQLQDRSLSRDRETATIGVTSSRSREGVSTVAANLAISAAISQNRPVLLADANMTSPSVAREFSITSGLGISDVLSGRAELNECVLPLPTNNLFVLPAGSTVEHTRATHDTIAIAKLLNEMTSQFGLVVFDLAPATELSSCIAMAGQLGGVILVVEAEKVRREAVDQAKKRLLRARAKLLGVVLNKQRVAT
jgi:capsular exopolysaccharide synthesis family protein